MTPVRHFLLIPAPARRHPDAASPGEALCGRFGFARWLIPLLAALCVACAAPGENVPPPSTPLPQADAPAAGPVPGETPSPEAGPATPAPTSTPDSPPPEAAPPTPPLPALLAAAARAVTGIQVVSGSRGTQAIVTADGTMEYEYALEQGKILAIDIFKVTNAAGSAPRPVGDGRVRLIRLAEHARPEPRVRVTFELIGTPDYRVIADGNRLLVNFGELAAEGEDRLRALAMPTVERLDVETSPERILVRIRLSAAAAVQTIPSDDPSRLVLEIPGARLSPEAQKSIDLDSSARELSKVVTFQHLRNDLPTARIVLQFSRQVPFRVETIGATTVVDVPRPRPAAPVVPTPPAAVPTPVPATPARPEPVTPPVVMTPTTAPEVSPPAEPADDSPRLSMNFDDAAIREVLNLVARVGGITLRLEPGVGGRVSVRLDNVPWQIALEKILAAATPPLAMHDHLNGSVHIFPANAPPAD